MCARLFTLASQCAPPDGKNIVHLWTGMSSARAGPTWATDTTAPVLARLLAAHADCAGQKEKNKTLWHSVQLPALELSLIHI